MVKYCNSHVLEMPNGELREHLFYAVDWFKSATSTYLFKKPVSVWSRHILNDGPGKYIPVQRIKRRCAWTKMYVGHQPVIVISPLPSNVWL